MQKVQIFFQNIIIFFELENLKNIFEKIINLVVSLTGFSYGLSKLFFIIIIIYSLFMIFFRLIHKRLTKKLEKLKDICIGYYDELWYEVSLTMYEINQKARSNGIENQLVHGVNSIIKLEKNDYLSNRKKIFQDLEKLEQYTGKKIVSAELITKINQTHKKITKKDFYQKIILRILTILTLGIYKLFY